MAMAEAAAAAATAAAPCLMRSVSQPLFASREFKEGDPLRALTTSVSFGRFMNEPLDWERWSSFSHNRIREDVQKHSRPGAVAEKKAFFEAYFNRFASKKSAKPPKKENRPPNYSPQTHVSPVTISNNKENHPPTVATDENMRNKGAESEITSNQDVSSPSPLLPKTENVDDIISNTCLVEQEKTLTENVSSPIVPSNTDMERDVDEIANVDEKPSTNLGEENISDVEENVSSDKGTEEETTSKKDVCSSTTNLVFSEVKNIDDIISSGGQMEQEKTSTENVSSEKHCSDVKISNQSGHVDRNKKRQIKDKKATQTKTEISSVKSSSRKAPIPEIHPKNQIFKHNPMVSSVNGVKKNTHALPKSENKRSRPLLERLVNGNKTVVPKANSTNHSDASIASTKKPTSVTVPSSFSFKSDERAAKRKQFFQKLEEKPKLKEKARSDDKKLRWSTAVEAKPFTSETKGPTNKLQKVQATQTSQKLGTKPKNFIELNKKMLSSSMAFLRSRKSHDTRN
ncbi:protein WVD2-like 7 isoform X2 [Helianthus annuus]|uniref:protein WVD2-like 7 isoform X2 n=1 Tax=Helianthus annuus TaxID=4232 RepID=UPI000B902F45|nr:protein WVD2-like 7 isoform X2 [Helianthus annuus]